MTLYELFTLAFFASLIGFIVYQIYQRSKETYNEALEKGCSERSIIIQVMLMITFCIANILLLVSLLYFGVTGKMIMM